MLYVSVCLISYLVSNPVTDFPDSTRNIKREVVSWVIAKL